ncbi:MAG TPA: hypothetical protein DEF82_01865 [Crocinitomicaceae bacterium]|nr:hypothetical protein [Flavobacteriales bacterium]HBW85517.1 hypothetical protein [Crocinitomicaceae bacterium]
MKSILNLIILLLPIVTFCQTNLNINPDLLPHLDKKLAPFYHGVASGDPTQNSVVIWTKLTLDRSIKSSEINWEIATDSLFKNEIQKGKAKTNVDQDFTVKVSINNLKPNTNYYYRFKYRKFISIIGQTKTLINYYEPFTIAFASCSNYEWGYFNNYRFIAEDKNIDLVVHLGDYIYEYAVGKYGDTSIGRLNIPNKEIISLMDYRTRYSLYRLDKDLIKLHQLKPFITTWDDHEIANNAYMDGAQNHNSNEGDWYARKAAATKAYYEWMPVSKKADKHLYRSFEIGNLVNLIILDTRIEGRTIQADSISSNNFLDSNRTILGKEQYNWLTEKINTKSTWTIIGNQVPFGPMFQPNPIKGALYMDGWDGYPYEREKFIHFIEKIKLKNLVMVTGDYHSSFAMESDLKGTKETNDNIAVEFIVTSITSANDDEYNNPEIVKEDKELYLKNNPHMKYCNNADHGYLVLKINKEEIIAEFIYANTIKKPTATKIIERVFSVKNGSPILIEK